MRKQTRTAAGVVLLAALVAVVTAGVGGDTASAARRSTKRRVVKTTPTTRVAPQADFNIRFVKDEQSVTAGAMATYTFDLSSSSSFPGAVVFDLPNLTDQFTGRVVAQSATSADLEISVPPFANNNSGVFVLRGRSGALVREATFRLNVSARPIPTTTTSAPPPPAASTTIAPAFTLTPTDVSRSSAPGEQQQYVIAVNRTGGFTGNVDFRVDGLPTGTTASFAPNPTSAGTVLYVTPSATTPSGTYLLSIVAQAGSTIHAAAVRLVVVRVGDFTLGMAPTVVNVPAGNDAVTAVNVVPKATTAPGTSPNVQFAASGLPAGAVAIFDPNPANGLTTLRIRTAPTTPLGTYKATITGTSGSFSRSVILTIVIEKGTVGSFGLAASPVSAAVTGGVTTYTYNVTISPNGGFNSTITFVVRNLPPFATASIVAQTATSATIKVTTTANTPTGTFPLLITGTAGALSATIQVDLLVS